MYINLSKYPDPNKTYSVNFPELNGGLNLRDADYLLKTNESPYMMNMWWKDGMLQCRPGQEEIATTVDVGEPARSGETLAAYSETFYDHAFVHIGQVMYYFDPSVVPVVYHPMLTDLNPVRGTFFRYKNDLFYKNRAFTETIVTGGNSIDIQHHGGFYRIQYMPEDRLKFVMSRVEDEAYVPTTVLNADPDTGSGDLYQPENRLTGRKRAVYKSDTKTEEQLFIGDGETTAFSRSAVPSVRGPRCRVRSVYVGGEIVDPADYTVTHDATPQATVTFATAPDSGAHIRVEYWYKAHEYTLPAGGGVAAYDKTIRVTVNGSKIAQVFNLWDLAKDSEQLPAGVTDYLTASTRLLKLFKNGVLTTDYTESFQGTLSPLRGGLSTSVIQLSLAPATTDTLEFYIGVKGTYYSAHAEQVFVDGEEYFDQDLITLPTVSGQTIYQLSPLSSGLYPAVGRMLVRPEIETTPTFSYDRDSGVLTLAAAIDAGHTLNLSPKFQFSTVDAEYVRIDPAPTPGDPDSSTVEITYSCDNSDAYNSVMDCAYAFTGAGKDSLCILLGGCPRQPNAVFWNSNDSVAMNPAYFPMSYYNLVGDTEDAVTGFGRQYSDLIVFKERSTHKLEYGTQTLDGRELISFTAKPVNAKIGCDLPWTIQLIENNLVFCNTYTGAHILLSSSAAYENNVASLSLKVNEGRRTELPGLLSLVRSGGDGVDSKVRSFDDDHRYWLVCEGAAFLWDYEVSSYTDPSWFYFSQLGGNEFFRDTTHNTYHVGAIAKTPTPTVGGLTRFKHGLYSDYGSPIYKHYQFAVQTLGSFTRQKDVTQVVFALPGDVPANIGLSYLTDLEARSDPTSLTVTPPALITGINPLGPVVAIRRPDCRHIRSFSAALVDNTANKGLAIVSAQVFYSGKAIYRVRDAREYAMLPEEYEVLPKKDKEAIQGISDPLDHLTDLMDAYNAAYDHPVEGAQDVEAYYLLTHVFPSIEVAKFAITSAYEKQGISEVVSAGDNWLDVVNASTGEISSLSIAPTGGVNALLGDGTKAKGWKIYLDFGELPIVSTKLYTPEAEKSTAPEGDINDSIDTVDDDFVVDDDDDLDELIEMGEVVVKIIDGAMAGETKPTTEPTTHADVDPQTYQIKSQPVNLFSLPTLREKNAARASDGHVLTVGQAEYFADSYARDADGRLLTMYHGTNTYGFTVFNGNPIFLADRGDASLTYFHYTPDTEKIAEEKAREKVGNLPRGDDVMEAAVNDELLEMYKTAPDRVAGIEKAVSDLRARTGQPERTRWGAAPPAHGMYSLYANATNPVIIDCDGRAWNHLPYWRVQQEEGLLRGKGFTWEGTQTDDIVAKAFKDGYDSVIFRNIRDYMTDNVDTKKPPFTVIVCKDSNQVKSTNNLVPTDDPDILYMLPEDADPREYSSSNRPLTAAQMVTFADSQLRDEMGRLKNMYVGRQSFGYEWFDPSKQSDKRSLFMTDNPFVASSYSGWPRSVPRLRDLVHSIDRDTDLSALSQPIEDDIFGEWDSDVEGAFHDAIFASSEEDNGALERKLAATYYLQQKGFKVKETALTPEDAAARLESAMDKWGKKIKTLTKGVVAEDKTLLDVFEDFGLTDALEMFEEAETREEKAEAIRGAADAFISVANDIDSFEEDTINVSDRLAKKVFRYADQLAAAADQFYEGLFEGDDLVPDGRTFLRALPADEQADFMGVDTFGNTKFYELKSPDDTFGTRLVSEDELVYQAIKLEMSLQDMVFGFGKSRPGIYEVYGNLKNPLILNEGGTPVMWNGMPLNLLPENMQGLGRQVMAQRGHTLLSTRDTSEIAERGGYDGVIIYNCMDVGEFKTHGVTNYTPSTIAVAFRPEQIKSTSNLAPTRDKRIAYMLPEDYAGEFTDLTPVVELGRALLKAENSSVDAAMLPANIGSIADISPDAMGRVILRRRFDNLGSARAGFDPYSAAQIKYGSMESRPGAYRYANAPKSVDGRKPVTQSAVTVASSEATPESRLKDIEDAVLDGKLSHEVKTDRAAMAKAKESLNRDGWNAAYAKWVDQVRSGKHDKATVAMGALLLDVAGNSDRASGNLYVDILQDYAAVLTRAGQILQAGKLIQQLTPMGKLYGIERSVERMNEEIIAKAEKAGVETEGIQIDPILLVEYRDAQTDAERQAALEKIYQNIADQIPATAMDKFTAWRYTAMLGNFRTQIRNVVGNFGFQPIRIMKETTAGLMEALVNTVSGGKLERTTSAFYDRATFKKAKEMFDQDADIIMGGGKYNDRSSRDTFNQEVERRRRIFKTKALEAWRKGTNWAMDKGDLVFCSFTYADSLARFMKANNATWDEASPELQERARLKAIKDAAEATYRDSNAFADAFARLLRQQNTEGNPVKKALNLIGEGILPFRKTPANILLRSLEYSPLNILGVAVKMAQYNLAKAQLINEPGKLGQQVNKAISAAKEADVTGADIVSALAQTLTGSALVLLGFSLASMGHLVGKAPDDDKEKEFWELMGHQEYSLEYNGHSYTLDWLAPESIPLYLGANLHAAALSRGLTLKEALEAVGSITDPMLQMSMLQGVNDALENASTYGDESALPRFVENAMWSYLTQFVPTLVGQANRSLNNQRMSTYVDKNKDVPDFWQKLSGKITGKIPGLNNITGAQIAYIDAWGRTEKNADTATENVLYQLFSPGYASTIEETAMEKELQRLYEATGKKSVLISRADKYFNVGGERVDLTGAQYLTYSQTRGQTAFRLMSNLTASAEYRGMTDDQKAKAVESVYQYANEVAKETTLRDYEITESWVLKAREAANEYNFPVSDYVNLYASGINSVRGITDANGDTITNTASMRKAQMIYQMYPNLTSEQYSVLFDDFNVGKTVRGWAPALIDRKLAALGG